MPSVSRVSTGLGANSTERSKTLLFVLSLLAIFLFYLLRPFALGQEVSTSAQVEGSVRDWSGNPIAGAWVSLQRAGDSKFNKTQTSAAGEFTLSALLPGIYNVRIEKSCFDDVTSDSVKLEPGEKKRFEFILRPSDAARASTAGIELDDKPNFTVAGMSDAAGYGGHGSETRIRTGDALAKETAKLESSESLSPRSAEDLSKTRDQIEKKLSAQNSLGVAQQADLRHELADIQEKLNDPLAAEREFARAASLDSSERNYFGWGAELLLHGAAAPAMEIFSKGVHLYPDSARMLAGLGAALYTSGATESAAQRLCQAADLEPLNPAPYLFLGRMQEAASNPLPCAEERLARFATKQPTNAQADYYYALALWKLARGTETGSAVPRAEMLLKKAAELDPKFAPAFLQLGNLMYSRNAFGDAIVAYQKAIEINPAASEAHYRLGLAYKRIGERVKAQNEIAAYKALDHAEAAKIGEEKRELGQFLFVLKDSPPSTHSDMSPKR